MGGCQERMRRRECTAPQPTAVRQGARRTGGPGGRRGEAFKSGLSTRIWSSPPAVARPSRRNGIGGGRAGRASGMSVGSPRWRRMRSIAQLREVERRFPTRDRNLIARAAPARRAEGVPPCGPAMLLSTHPGERPPAGRGEPQSRQLRRGGYRPAPGREHAEVLGRSRPVPRPGGRRRPQWRKPMRRRSGRPATSCRGCCSTPTFHRAAVGVDRQALKIESAQDSAFRFYAVQTDERFAIACTRGRSIGSLVPGRVTSLPDGRMAKSQGRRGAGERDRYPNIRLTMNTAPRMPAVSASRHAGTVWRVRRMPTAP